MHKRLIKEGFNRRFVLVPLLLSVGLVVLGFAITEARRAQTRQLDDVLSDRQEVLRLISETISSTLEAESAQRGFLLTGESQYLAPMDTGLAEAQRYLEELILLYRGLDPSAIPVLEGVRRDLDRKMQEMQQTVTLLKLGQARQSLDLVKFDVGLQMMQSISDALGARRARERDKVLAGLSKWDSAMRLNTMISLGSMVFTILVLMTLGLLATRDIRRRESFATDLASQIDERTTELRDLSRHMSRVAEAEKYALARELHDELGGVLVAMRMDISQIRKRLGNEHPELKTHWERVEQALASGLELKRRVIEELRPTLLDNMGLFTALRWLATQRSEQAQIKLELFGLEEDIDLPPETAIAVFRTVQEAIANTLKHAGATRLSVHAEVSAEHLSVSVADNGRGLPPDAERRSGAHGLKQMRFRMESVGGTLRFTSYESRGTTIELTVPLMAAAPAA